jgi:hypothetical protein
VRLLQNQSYSYIQEPALFGTAPPYFHYRDVTVRYTHPWNSVTLGGEVEAGRDVFGKSFSRISGFVRYGGDEHTRDDDSPDEETPAGDVHEHGAEVFVDAGMNANKLRINLDKDVPVIATKVAFGPHVGVGARRAVSETNDLGVRIELDGDVDGHTLIGARAVDYRHRFTENFALSGFAGVARYNLATPAYSLYAGAGAQWRDILHKWDLGIDFRYAQNVTRDRVLASDFEDASPGSSYVRPDIFYKIESATLYVTRRF